MNGTDSRSPVYAYLKNPTMIDFPGHMAAVFFLSGCNFRCGFCHNAALMGRPRETLTWERLGRACRHFSNNWVDGAVISGGEPTLCPALPELISFLRRHGWQVKLDTNGSRPDALEQVLPLVDYVAMDVKTAPSAYAGLTGWGDTDAIARSVELIKAHARDYEFRTTVLDPLHSDAAMHEIGRLVAGARRYVLQPFVPQPGLPDPQLETLSRTSDDRLAQLARLLHGSAGQIQVRGQEDAHAEAAAA